MAVENTWERSARKDVILMLRRDLEERDNSLSSTITAPPLRNEIALIAIFNLFSPDGESTR